MVKNVLFLVNKIPFCQVESSSLLPGYAVDTPEYLHVLWIGGWVSRWENALLSLSWSLNEFGTTIMQMNLLAFIDIPEAEINKS